MIKKKKKINNNDNCFSEHRIVGHLVMKLNCDFQKVNEFAGFSFGETNQIKNIHWKITSSLKKVTALGADWLLKRVTCLSFKTGLWRLDKLSCRWHHQLAWVELRRTSLLQLPLQPFGLNLLCKLDLKGKSVTSSAFNPLPCLLLLKRVSIWLK